MLQKNLTFSLLQTVILNTSKRKPIKYVRRFLFHFRENVKKYSKPQRTKSKNNYWPTEELKHVNWNDS